MKVFDKLSPNQEAAVGKPCKEAGCVGTYVRRLGRYGPWVQCNNCRSKVYRPRGLSWQYQMQGLQEPAPTPVVQQTVVQGATQEQVTKAVQELATPVFSKLESKLERANHDAIRAMQTTVSAEIITVQSELAKLKAAQPVRIEITDRGAVVNVVQGAHFNMPRLLRLLNAGIACYPWGPAGSGKTTAAMQAAEAVGRASEIDTLDPTTFRSMVQGYSTPDGKPVHTAFTRCWEQGKVYIADEIDNAPGHVQTLFNSALANGHAPLAWGNVAKHVNFGFIGTGNTPGRPTREFPDRKPMSAAFMDRLYFIHWPLDLGIEARAVGLDVPAVPARLGEGKECSPIKWVQWVQKLRVWAAVNMPTLMVTPRASLVGLQALALGETPLEVAHGLIFRGADSEMVSKALNAVGAP